MSTKYYLWLKQRGEGCDYGIGCGETLLPLNGVTPDDGLKFTNRIKNKIKEYSYYGVADAMVVQKVGTVKNIIAQADKEEAEEEKLRTRAKKLEKLERLKKELGEY